jgi:hypothetical protein
MAVRLTRRAFLLGLASVGVATTAGIIYSRYAEPYWLEVSRRRIEVPARARGTRPLHHWDNRWMNVTRGVGNLHGLRFNCRPEISVIEIL